jgi:predicted transcriptional regulator YdeE
MPKDHTKDTDETICQRHLERIQLEIQRFQAKVAQNTRDSEQFMTLMEMEGAMSELRHSTQEIYSDMLSDTLQSIDEKPVVDKKKRSSGDSGSN